MEKKKLAKKDEGDLLRSIENNPVFYVHESIVTKEEADRCQALNEKLVDEFGLNREINDDL